MDVYVYKKKELQLSYFSICEGKKLDDKIVTYFALKAGSTVYTNKYELKAGFCPLEVLPHSIRPSSKILLHLPQP